jgi:tRNA threonylcarbamoyladenosine biosynthesis protein TsaE
MSFRFTSHNEADTVRFAQALAACLPNRLTVALIGTLGAGKTFLVRSFAACCGIDPETVVSPTFSLWQTYHGTRTIHHLDAYRIRDEHEFIELGVEECFAESAVTFIEWADRVEKCLDRGYLEVVIEPGTAQTREIYLVNHDQADDCLVACIAEALRKP